MSYESGEKTLRRNYEKYLKICTKILKNLKWRNVFQENNNLNNNVGL